MHMAYFCIFSCDTCTKEFFRSKKDTTNAARKNCDGSFCSRACHQASMKIRVKLTCKECAAKFERIVSHTGNSKNVFCSHSCNATYNNKHKTHGTRRSKLELWLEEQLTVLYPELEIHFNQKDTINSELDIYIPSLKLAFELNGIFHYEPIFGESKLNQITSNDISKTKVCFDAQIDLCVIDTSGQKYFKPKTSQKYLDIITSIVNERLAS